MATIKDPTSLLIETHVKAVTEAIIRHFREKLEENPNYFKSLELNSYVKILFDLPEFTNISEGNSYKIGQKEETLDIDNLPEGLTQVDV